MADSVSDALEGASLHEGVVERLRPIEGLVGLGGLNWVGGKLQIWSRGSAVVVVETSTGVWVSVGDDLTVSLLSGTFLRGLLVAWQGSVVVPAHEVADALHSDSAEESLAKLAQIGADCSALAVTPEDHTWRLGDQDGAIPHQLDGDDLAALFDPPDPSVETPAPTNRYEDHQTVPSTPSRDQGPMGDAPVGYTTESDPEAIQQANRYLEQHYIDETMRQLGDDQAAPPILRRRVGAAAIAALALLGFLVLGALFWGLT